MAVVRVLVVETDSVDEDAREITTEDILKCGGISNPDGDVVLTTSTKSKSINNLVSEILLLDSNKDNSVAGFQRSTMNNLTLYNMLQGMGGTLGPVVYPIVMTIGNKNNDVYLQWGNGIDSSAIPMIIPFNSKSIAISLGVRVASRFWLRIYKNANLTTPIFSYTAPANTLSWYADINFGQTGHFTLTAGDALSFRVTQVSGQSPGGVDRPAVTLWLQNT